MTEKYSGIIFEIEKKSWSKFTFLGKPKRKHSNPIQNMNSLIKFLKSAWKFTRNLLWALIVAFMLGVHNFYKGETRSKDDIVSHIEHSIYEEDDAPKD